jgi:hypothetical protein
MYGSASVFPRSTIKQHKTAPEKRRCFLFAMMYAFVGVCIATGVLDGFLLMESILKGGGDYSDYVDPEPVYDRAAYDITSRKVSGDSPRLLSASLGRCAINFFGLPRAYESLVLPSIIKNVIRINPGCDYYIHYYHMTEELGGRSGNGGIIDPTAILQLREAVQEIAKARNDHRPPIVEFVYDREDDFWEKYNDLIERIRTTKVNGKYLYFPWKAKTYRHPITTDNIIKMWHSVQSSYQLMEQTAEEQNINYEMVAMLRSDVVYVTPIDIHDAATQGTLVPVTVPDFGNYPVSDRIVYGPREAVKIWATRRFSSLESHVQFIQKKDPGWGLHSERFINYTIFPLMRNVTTIRKHPTICFFRARADESVWISDCHGASAPSVVQQFQGRTLRKVVEEAVGHACSGPVEQLTRTVKSLPCPKNPVAPVVAAQ